MLYVIYWLLLHVSTSFDYVILFNLGNVIKGISANKGVNYFWHLKYFIWKCYTEENIKELVIVE